MAKQEIEELAEESDVDRLIGGNVQQFRNAKKMSQAQLADAMTAKTGQQVAQQTILKIEKGTRPLRYSEAVAMAEALDVPLSALSPDRVTARERAHLEVAWIDAVACFSNAVQMNLDYVTSAENLKVVLDFSPNAESFFTANELAHMRWIAEGDYVQALEATRQALRTMPEMPHNPNPPF